jgi:pimeloyl-ACP methyl ester carboxylesterase
MPPRIHEVHRIDVAPDGYLTGAVSHSGTWGESAILFAHGFGSTREGAKAMALQTECARRGWTLAAFDFRGHGQSSGTMKDLRGSNLLADLASIRAFLASRGIRRLFPVGSSMGGWAAAWFAADHSLYVPALVLIAPAFNFPLGIWSRLDDAARKDWQSAGTLQVRNQWVEAEVGYGLVEEAGRFTPETLAAKWDLPLLICHGMCDDVVPFEQSLSWVRQVPGGKVQIHLWQSGDHRLLDYQSEIARMACDFFAPWMAQ